MEKLKFYKFDKTTLTYVKIKWMSIALNSLGILIAILLVLGFNSKFNPKSNYTEAEIMVIMGQHNKFSEEKLIDEIKSKHYKFPYIVFAQAKLESGNFKSKIFLENHNMFGMREAVLRINTAKGTQYEHAYYENWRSSLEDYGYYYSRYLSELGTEEEYYEYLSQNYAEDPRYVQTLKALIVKENLKSKFAN